MTDCTRLIGARARAATWKTQAAIATRMPSVHQRLANRATVERTGARQRTGGRRDRAALLEEEPEQRDDRAAEREQQAEGDGQRQGSQRRARRRRGDVSQLGGRRPGLGRASIAATVCLHPARAAAADTESSAPITPALEVLALADDHDVDGGAASGCGSRCRCGGPTAPRVGVGGDGGSGEGRSSRS